MNKFAKSYKGFTLIELLVVISIIGILIGLSIFGLQGARESARDARRKADLEEIRSGLEIYKSDCNKYPVQATPGELTGSMIGVGTLPSCVGNVYIQEIPTDPVSPSQNYLYYSADGTTYELCAELEGGGTTKTCGSSSSCGGTGCNYKVTSP